jgi:glycosyltransferase involved in cell wall biosynthesis
MSVEVCVNARFRHQRMTGVQRYADAVLARLPAGVQSLSPPFGSMARGLLGHVWEQMRLSSRVGNRVLWSPCNTGPLGVKKHVVTVHDTAFLDYPECFSRQFRDWYQWLVPRLVQSAARVLTVSKFSASKLVGYCGVSADKIEVIPNGVDERFCPASADERERVRHSHRLPREFVLTLGSIDPRKNLRRLCEVFQKQTALKDVVLVVAGGTSKIFAESYENLHASNVQFLDYVPDDELPALYSAATVFVYPSLYEGFGLPPLEAMACGTPAVVSATTALPEVVGDAAILVDPACDESMANGICRLLGSQSLREAQSQAGIRRAQQFNWNTTAKQVWNVLCNTE